MTEAEEIPPPPSAPEKPVTPEPCPWIWRLLITGASLTAAANYLIYSRGPGAGWALFFLFLAGAIFLNRRNEGLIRRIEITLAALLTVSAIQMVVRPSFSNAIVLFTLTLLASTHFLHEGTGHTSAGRKLVEALRGLLISPIRWLQATEIVTRSGISQAPNIAVKIPTGRNIVRALQIVVPALLITLPFLILLGKGNGILGQFISNAVTGLIDSLNDISPPSPARLVFIGFIATALLGLLWRSKPSRVFERVFSKLGNTIPAPGDHFVARWRTILILAGVNALFFAANFIDFTYLAAKDLQLPEHLTYSEFVHQGTNTLIASAIIAAIVLGLLFQQDRSVTQSRAIHALATLWIIQNILLIINVGRRVNIYISDYHLSVLRVHLILFLVLVCVGFTLLAIRILRDRSFGWLISANLVAVFVLFAGLQFWDTRKVVAEYNLERALKDHNKALDTYYLAGLGPSAWPTLHRATTAGLSFDERQNAADALESITATEARSIEGEDWRDFRWVRNKLRKQLLNLSETATIAAE